MTCETLPLLSKVSQVAYDIACLNHHLALAHEDWTGTWADAARHDLTKVKAALAEIEAVMSELPGDGRRAAA